MLRQFLGNIQEKLYEYDPVRAGKIRDWLRPLKHSIFGKSDIYYVLDVIKRARGEENIVKAVFDVGAAVGDKTVTFLEHFPEAIVYCFEPQESARQFLERRTEPWKSRVVLFDYGLYSKNREVQLILYSYRDASSILPLQEYMRYEGKSELGIETITVRRLDDVILEQNVARIDLIKIDVEGVEKEVLEGSFDALCKTDNVYVEISPLRKGANSSDHIDVFRILYEAGFTFMGQYGDYWFSKDTAVLEVYFKSREFEE